MQELMRRVSTWMKDDALFFCHVFCHKHYPYHFEVRPAACHAMSVTCLMYLGTFLGYLLGAETASVLLGCACM